MDSLLEPGLRRGRVLQERESQKKHPRPPYIEDWHATIQPHDQSTLRNCEIVRRERRANFIGVTRYKLYHHAGVQPVTHR